ncbi:MAG: acetolactate decarboxylase, partial [Candidatus Omnitrophica bacterium]|nr:acetolactate decarboxylase [Candidatus Omnitrophota bacterium]
MKKYVLGIVFFIIALSGCTHLTKNTNVLFQASTIGALAQGVYDGDMTYHELRTHGDFGIGTFDDLDGEMIALDNKFYQIKADGLIYPVLDNKLKAPFAVVTFFNPGLIRDVNQEMSYAQLTQFLDNYLKSP